MIRRSGLRSLAALFLLASPLAATAGDHILTAETIVEMKAVYGQVQARNSVLARARIGGTLSSLEVTEGDVVKAGQVIARIRDDKIDFQIKAVDAQLLGLQASLDNARSELDRAEKLIKSGATTAQRLDQFRTQVDIVVNQIGAAQAQRSVLVEQQREGAVLAPTSGTVLTVPVTRDAVVMAGESVATIAGGGFFLRLAIPERHAQFLKQGADIRIEAGGKALSGKLAKIYPEISGGRVTADVEVDGLETEFVGVRVLVELPVGERRALFAPSSALTIRAGIDFAAVKEGDKTVERAVAPGATVMRDGVAVTEILTGLVEGDIVVTP
ncbi:RND family efflux transporter MFP subunit [Rhizobium sp. SG_E_25_P2]|uniref:efflux RND transporter periplasmic adaptor subunit n=1 Tax=Rhizobium sp. SG_E_25_P2 TaxID=2879942 RepID=UPI002475014D|nr:efflux RND transporter periplasmic adaptor subunit [Rhizobium sp. SG_E_25_P2]MDH6265432.1 RND family efflux transporter MFP subunit [Rhizobium sp. SG_E_25_P2]